MIISPLYRKLDDDMSYFGRKQKPRADAYVIT